MSEEPGDEVIGTYGGDAFGNGGMILLRCRSCSGYYISKSFRPPVIGVILRDDGGRAQRQHESRLADIYERGSKCQCPKGQDQNQSLSWPHFGAPRPPMREIPWPFTTDGSGINRYPWPKQDNSDENQGPDDEDDR